MYLQVNFGAGYAGLSTVGYTLYNADGTLYQSRITEGVSERGSGTGVYGVESDLVVLETWTGEIRWDTGQAVPVYASTTLTIYPSAVIPPYTPSEDSYATTANLAAYLGIDESALPSDAVRLILRATDMVKYTSLNRVSLSNSDHVTAAGNATCAQVEWWIVNGEGTEPAIKSKSFGKTSITYADSSKPTNGICDRARQYLFLAGLLDRSVMTI